MYSIFLQNCGEVLANVQNFLNNLQVAMKLRPDLLHIACNALRLLYETDNTVLIKQTLDSKFLDFLLNLLASSMLEVENAQAVKAEIVNTVKSMAINLEYADQVLFF